MRIRQVIRNNLSRTAASVALTLFMSLAAPVTAQALIPSTVPDTAVTLGSHFADTKKNTKKKDSKKKDSKKDSKGKKKGGGSGGSKTKTDAPTAVNLSPIHSGGLPTTDADTDTVKTILQIVFGIIGAFALMSTVASGLKYVTSGGDPGKTSEAKKGIIFALVGLMIAISAQAIIAFVVHRGAP
jgi:hypothetical protein